MPKHSAEFFSLRAYTDWLDSERVLTDPDGDDVRTVDELVWEYLAQRDRVAADAEQG